MKTVGLFLAISLCTLSRNNLHGQNRSKNLEIGVSQNFLLNHPEGLKDIFNLGLEVIYWTDFKLSQNEDNTREPAYPYNAITNNIFGYPLIGLYGRTILGLNRQIGSPLSLGLTTDITFYQKENFILSFRPKLGLSYFINQEEKIRTPALNSKLNLNTQVGVYYTYQKRKKAFKAGLNVDYYTNGSLKKPSGDLAFLTLSLAYQLGPKLLPFFSSEREEFKKQYFTKDKEAMKVYFQSGILSKQISPDSKQYVGLRSYLGLTKPLNPVLGLNAQLMHTYDPSIRDELASKNLVSTNGNRIGLSAGPRFTFHRFSFSPFLGIYAYKPEKNLDRRTFQSYHLEYTISKNLYVYSSILAHLNITDAAELGLGIKI